MPNQLIIGEDVTKMSAEYSKMPAIMFASCRFFASFAKDEIAGFSRDGRQRGNSLGAVVVMPRCTAHGKRGETEMSAVLALRITPSHDMHHM